MHYTSHAFFAPFLDLPLIVRTPLLYKFFTLKGLILFLGGGDGRWAAGGVKPSMAVM